VTDCLQALSLIVDSDFRFRWSTWHYGVAIFSVMWAPAPVAFLHWTSAATYSSSSSAAPYTSGGRSLVEGLWFLVCFPAVPIVLFMRVLHTKRKFLSPAEAEQFLTLETRARELKSITGKASYTFLSVSCGGEMRAIPNCTARGYTI
jgi:hypothetical protein